MYVVVLDEMNVAQVDRYFMPILQELGKELSDNRSLKVFDPSRVSCTDMFAPFHTLKLPPTLRFAGTVNYDENTQRFVSRVLDRSAEMLLQPPEKLVLGQSPVVIPAVPGPQITVSDVSSWRSTDQLGVAEADFLQRLSDALALIGCGVGERRFRAIRRFVDGSMLIPSSQALDLAISERVLPAARGYLGQPAAPKVLELMAKAFAAWEKPLPVSERVLNHLRQQQESQYS
jgi:hypothetical protein